MSTVLMTGNCPGYVRAHTMSAARRSARSAPRRPGGFGLPCMGGWMSSGNYAIWDLQVSLFGCKGRFFVPACVLDGAARSRGKDRRGRSPGDRRRRRASLTTASTAPSSRRGTLASPI